MYMFEDYEFRHAAKAVICLLGIALAFGYYLRNTGAMRPLGRRLFDLALVLVALLSVAAYFEFGWKRFDIYMNPHDVYHYYLGAKYSEEHEYYNLYRAALIADHETGAHFHEARIRNLDDNSQESVKSVLARADEIKSHFSPARWEEFKKDLTYFRDLVPYWKFKHMLSDKGYNAAPVWNATARWITEHVPTDNPQAMAFITYIDLILLAIMYGFIGLAFGWRAMLLAVIFHDVNYFMAFVHIKGAFMRLDWYVATVAAVCLLRLRWNATAGVLMAWAAMSRVFPVIFCFGIGVKFLANLFEYWREQRSSGEAARLDTSSLKFFVGLGLALTVLFGASVYADGGLHLWTSFLSKIEMHNSDISTTRAGFKYIFLADYVNRAAAFEQYHTIWQLIIAGVLCVTLLLAWRAPLHEALCLGFIPFFFMTAPTFYYFVILMVPFLYFLSRPRSFLGAFGLAACFLLSIFCYNYGFVEEHGFRFFFIASCALLGLTGYMAACAVLRAFSAYSPDESNAIGSTGEPATSFASETLRFVTGMVLAAAFVASGALAYTGLSGQKVHGLVTKTESAINRLLGSATPLSRDPQLDPDSSDDMETIMAGAKATAAETTPVRPVITPPAVPQPAQNQILVAPVAIPPATGKGEIELVFVGDIMMDRGVVRSLKQNNRSYNFPFEVAAPLIQQAAIAFGNLECPVSGRGEKLATKRYVFNAQPEAASALKYAGFDIVSVANNHTLDYGPVALEDTLSLVAAQGIEPIGITTNDDPQTAAIFEKDGIRVGYLCYADPVPGYSYAKEFYVFEKRPAKGTRENIARDIAALRDKVDILVVSMHWGTEYKPPSQQQIDLGHYIIDQGADIVAGHHPHIQHDAQLYKDGLIIYSMGNFVFDQRSRPATRESRLYRVYVAKDGFKHAEFLPMDIPLDVWQPRPTADAFVQVTATEPPVSMEAAPGATSGSKEDSGG